jgi:hypothetical protein
MRMLVVLLEAVIGAILGGGLGLFVGIGALAIPGFGPMIAAGTLATALGTAAMGMTAGALIGGLIGIAARGRSRQRLND